MLVTRPGRQAVQSVGGHGGNLGEDLQFAGCSHRGEPEAHYSLQGVAERAAGRSAPAEADLSGQLLGGHLSGCGVAPQRDAMAQQDNGAGADHGSPALLQVGVVERKARSTDGG